VRAKFQRAIVAVLEESLAINAEEFFRLLDGDPTDLRKILSLYLGKNKYGSN